MTESNAAMARQDDVVRAAIGVFLRYGYARTTMGDIAQAAGLTRPTLYLTFPGKERIFTAVVEKMIEDKLIEIRGGLPRQKSLETKLRFACNAWAAEGYELVKAHPDAADMFDLGFKSVCAGYDQFGALLAEILDEPLGRSSLELSARDAARAVVFAMRGFKDVATSGAEMRGLIETHVKLVAGAIEPKSGRSKEALPRRK